MMPLGPASMSSDLETARQLLALAQQYLDRGELAKAAQALSQAEEIVTAAAKQQAPRESAELAGGAKGPEPGSQVLPRR